MEAIASPLLKDTSRIFVVFFHVSSSFRMGRRDVDVEEVSTGRACEETVGRRDRVTGRLTGNLLPLRSLRLAGAVSLPRRTEEGRQ